MKARGPTVLLVEDDPNHELLVDIALQRAAPEIRLRCVPNGDHAIRYLSGEEPFGRRDANPLPDVIILDIRLPVISGFEVLEWIQSQDSIREIPVLVFTSSDDPEDAKRAYGLGARAYRRKSEDFGIVAEEVQALLQRWVSPSAP